jgi:hypothetical protein
MLAERFKPFASLVGVGAVLAAWLVVFNLSFAAMNRTGLMSWLPDRTSGIGYLLESKQRVDGAEAYLRSRPASAEPPLVAVIGISDVREGTRLEILSQKARNRLRFIGVAGAGAGFGSVEEQASLVLNSKLRPAAVVIGVSPMQMIEGEDFEQGAAKVAAANGGDVVENTKATVREALWFVQRRSDLVGWLDRYLLKLKMAIRNGLGQETAADPRSPWRPLLRTLKAEHYPEAVLRRSLATIEASGTNQIETITRSRAPFLAAGSLIQRFENQGADVIIMVMPRHPWLEARVPSSADDMLASRLRKAASNPNLKILDYSNSVPAGGFIDLVHLNTNGGEFFSRRLADDLLSELCHGKQTCSRKNAD